MLDDKDKANASLFNAAAHLTEAAKYMSDMDKGISLKIFAMADKILSIIDAPQPKLSNKELDDILEEILNAED